MSPEIRIKDRFNGELIEVVGNVPDQSGTYLVKRGQLTVDMSGVDPRNPVQRLIVELPIPSYIRKLMEQDPVLRDYYLSFYRKEIHLSPEGKGSTGLNNYTVLEAQLHTPIRKRGEGRQTKPPGLRANGLSWAPRDISKPKKR